MQRAFIEVFKIAKNAFIDPIYLSEYSKVDVACDPIDSVLG